MKINELNESKLGNAADKLAAELNQIARFDNEVFQTSGTSGMGTGPGGFGGRDTGNIIRWTTHGAKNRAEEQGVDISEIEREAKAAVKQWLQANTKPMKFRDIDTNTTETYWVKGPLAIKNTGYYLRLNTKRMLQNKNRFKPVEEDTIAVSDLGKAKKQGSEAERWEEKMSFYDKIKKARANPSSDKPVRGRGSKNRNPKTYDPRKALDKEDDRIQTTIKKKLKREDVKQGRINEGFKLQLERDVDMMVLHITDTKTGRRTEVRGKAGYETRGYDANDKLHQLLDKIGKSVDISQLINGEPVGINPKLPAGASAKAATTKAFSEEAGVGKITKQNTTPDVKPGETERQAKKFFPMNKNGKPKPMGVKGATPNQAFNLGMTENISVTGTERGKQARKKKLRPGSEAWFKHWFSLPLMKRESFEQAKAELIEHIHQVKGNLSVKPVTENIGSVPSLSEFILMAVAAKTTVSKLIAAFNSAVKTGKDIDKLRKLHDHIKDMGNDSKFTQRESFVIPASERFIDAALQALHRLVTSKGTRQSVGGYAFDIARAFGSIDVRELEDLYRKQYGVTEEFNYEDYFKDYSDAKLLSVISYGLGKQRENAKTEWERRKASGEKWRWHNFNEEKLETKSIITPSIKALDKIFKQNKFDIRIVGGAVRDIALGKEPKDIDFATDATPDAMQKMFDKAGIRHIPTGLEHGTITAVINGEDFEITTLRADKVTDGRHAEVEFVKSWEEDAKRRDLTYNAMSMDMEGNVFDYFDGMDDLQDKVSKFVGDPEERITEDYLRILRYFRFQGRLSTPSWNEDTLKAISSNVKGLQNISAERIWQEMSKVLAGNNVANVLNHMTKTGVNKVIGLSTNDLNKVKDKGNPIIALAQMGNTTDIVKRWRLSNNESALLDFLVKNKNNSLDQKKVEDMIADGVSKDLISALATLQGKDLNIDAEVPDFPVTGADLIAKGMNPGPEMGAKLGQLKQQWKQSNFTATKDELLKEVTEFVTLKKGDKMVKVPKSRLEFYLGQHYELVEGITEAVHTFMTGHDVTFAGKKYDKIEIEVTGVDNASKKYNIMILSPKELFGKTVAVSSKYMERGPWTKTETPDAFAGEKDAH